MTRFVLDPVALIALVRDGRPVGAEHQLVGPNTLRSQALERLLREVGAGRMTEAQALALHERMTELKMRLLGDRVSRRTAWNIARDNGWDSLGQAEYLAVTRLQADALIAGDEALARAAAGLVTLAPLESLF